MAERNDLDERVRLVFRYLRRQFFVLGQLHHERFAAAALDYLPLRTKAFFPCTAAFIDFLRVESLPVTAPEIDDVFFELRYFVRPMYPGELFFYGLSIRRRFENRADTGLTDPLWQ